MVILLQIIFIVLFLIAVTGSIQSLIHGPGKASPGEVSPHFDNVFRFMSGLYFGVSLICLWMVVTMEEQRFLVYLIALSVMMAGMGRIVSIRARGIPSGKFYFYVSAELMVSILIVIVNSLRE